MKNELLGPGDIIEIKDNLVDGEYTCIVANIDGAYRLISLDDGYDFMVEEEGHDFWGYTREDFEKYLTDRDWEVIKYYRGLEEFLVIHRPKMKREQLIEALKEVGNITLNSKQVKDVLPKIYEYFAYVFRFMKGDFPERYLIKICFLPDYVTYTFGIDAQRLANEPHWVKDRWDYFQTEELVALLKVAKQDEEE